MAKRGVLGGFASGILVGIDQGLKYRTEQERKDREEARRKEADDRTREQYESGKRERDRAEADQVALRAAGTPATVSEAGALPIGLQFASNEDADAAAAGQPNPPMPDVPRFRVETGTGAQRFDTREQADAAAAEHNTPAALSQRMSQTLMAQGKPLEALKLSKEAQAYADEMWRDSLGKAIMGGHEGIADLANKSEGGPFRGKQVKPVVSEDGKNVTYHVVNPDGTTRPTNLTFPNSQDGAVQAAFMLDSTIKPMDRYKFMTDKDRREKDLEIKERNLTLREDMLEKVQKPIAEARALALEAKAGRDNAAATGGDPKAQQQALRERESERKRISTLQREASRHVDSTQKQINSLLRDPLFSMRAKKEGTPEAGQLADLRDQLKDHQEDLKHYTGQLAELEPAQQPAPTKVPPATQAARDGDRVTILKGELAKTQEQLAAATDPDQRRRLQSDVDALNNEIAGTKGGKATPARGAAQPAAPKPGKGAVPSPTSKAEYDALPAGAKYHHPDDPAGVYRTKGGGSKQK